jgi:hypothetical protein
MKKNRRRKKLSEDAAYQIALRDHPEYRRRLENDTLPDEILQDNGQPMNPRLHLQAHTIVERQLSADEPRGVVAIANQLAELGVSEHDIRHYLGQAVTEQIWTILAEKRVFDEKEYFARLAEIVDSVRRERRAQRGP